ncbi:MAG: hypothetical protein J6386_20205 [Candidatus Synoicihabitans palmerolidicus]|nr:hypothetical protein [Candidatus Synoicihabitans palmerolidicus]
MAEGMPTAEHAGAKQESLRHALDVNGALKRTPPLGAAGSLRGRRHV